MTEIIIKKVQLSDGVARFDMYFSGIPDNFLGIATDIVFSGDVSEVSYRGMEWGSVFEGLEGAQLPINMVKYLPNEGRLVMGITLKANDLPVLSDGYFASFVFKDAEIEAVGFENSVLSVFDGARRDVTNVIWTISKGDQSAEVIQQLPLEVGQVQGTRSLSSESSFADLSTVESNVFDKSILDIISSERKETGDMGIFLGGGIIAVLVLVFVLLILFLMFGKKLKNLLLNIVRSVQISVKSSKELSG